MSGVFYLCHIFCEAWTSSSQIFLGFAIIAAIVAIRRGELEVPPDELYIPLILFVAGSILSAIFSPASISSIGEVSEFFTFMSLPLAFALYTRLDGFHRRALVAFGLMAALISLWGQFEWVVLGWRDLEHRISGPAAHVMTLSGLLIIVSILMISIAVRKRSFGALAVFVLTVVTLAMTQTRGAWIGWVVGLSLLVLMRVPKMIPWVGVAFLLILILSPTSLFGRISSAVSLTPASNYDRVMMVRGGVEMIRDHPVFGTGPGSTKDNYVLYRDSDALRFRTPHLHNNVVQIWAERGLMPVLAYLLLIGMLLVRFWRVSRMESDVSWYGRTGFAIVVAMTVAGLFEFNFGDSEVMVALLDASAWCLAGAGAVGTEKTFTGA